MDFFTVPTVTFKLLYCFFVISHDRRRILHCVIAFNEAHLKRLLSHYLRYYHDDRTHLGLVKQTPANRIYSGSVGRVLSFPRLGGMHHRYERAA